MGSRQVDDLIARLAFLVPGAAVAVLSYVGAAGELVLFVLAAVALIPIAWLIGEATEQVGLHTGPGIGGFLNASFGNTPELIIALVAVSQGLPEVVRASLVGSVVGNLLLVLGFALLAGPRADLDRTSAATSLGIVGLAALLMVIPATLAFKGAPDRHSLAELSVPVAVSLLIVRVVANQLWLRRHRRLQAVAEPAEAARWSLALALGLLAAATLTTAFVSDTLVASIGVFAKQTHLSQFFVAAVIVAIAGNASEHGSAVLLAARGQIKLATEIALASSAQVAGFLIPVVALLSWLIHPLALSFRAIELAGMAAAVLAAGLVLASGRSSRVGGAFLVGVYVAVAASFYLVGDR
jgi:Ca2+:H+ antiporter